MVLSALPLLFAQLIAHGARYTVSRGQQGATTGMLATAALSALMMMN
jgi:hypothetical protein